MALCRWRGARAAGAARVPLAVVVTVELVAASFARHQLGKAVACSAAVGVTDAFDRSVDRSSQRAAMVRDSDALCVCARTLNSDERRVRCTVAQKARAMLRSTVLRCLERTAKVSCLPWPCATVLMRADRM